MNNNFKKVNLVPSSFFLNKKLKVGMILAFCVFAIAVACAGASLVAMNAKLTAEEEKIANANKIINSADFSTLESLKSRYEVLLHAGTSSNLNTVPNVYEDMTDFLDCIVNNMPSCMTLENIEGDFSNAGIYSYTFDFKSSDRSEIAPFLQRLQNEETLKYVNISAITLRGSTTTLPNGSNNTDDVVQKDENGQWGFSLVIKTKGGN